MLNSSKFLLDGNRLILLDSNLNIRLNLETFLSLSNLLYFLLKINTLSSPEYKIAEFRLRLLSPDEILLEEGCRK